jgi:GntR family transcriptional regulator, transcriptional repressor for pyruvate dehydrogenase complex
VDDPPVVTAVKVARAYEQLAGDLRRRISAGDLRPGDRLPSETSLAQQAGVSRSTVREALRTLQEAGLIVRASPRVMVVADDTGGGPAFRELRLELRRRNVTFHHLHEALATLEPILTGYAAERRTEADLRAMREALEAQEHALDDVAEWSRLDIEFHLLIAEASGNPALIVAREPLTQVLLPTLHRFMSSRAQTEAATRYHHRIVAEVESGDAELAAAVMRRHVNDFRIAWEKAGLDFHQSVASLDDPDALSLG